MRSRQFAAQEKAPWLCGVYGCSNLSYGHRYCQRCEHEIVALDLTYERQMERHTRMVARRRAIAAWLKARLWIVNLIFVAGVLMALYADWLKAVIAWLESGGPQ
jgi:hypothetical protein